MEMVLARMLSQIHIPKYFGYGVIKRDNDSIELVSKGLTKYLLAKKFLPLSVMLKIARYGDRDTLYI